MQKKRAAKTINIGQELRGLGALIEHNNDRISAVAEQYQSINKKLDSHGEIIGKLAVDMEIVKTNVEFMLERRVHSLEAKNK